MKKLFLIALMAIVSTVSFAQIKWNVQAGANMSMMTDIDDSKMKFGYQFGVGMEYAFDEMWSIRPSLLLITKGVKQDIKYPQGEKDENTFNPMYLQLPVMAAASFDLSESMKFVVKAGPYIGFGIGGKAKFESFEENSCETYKYDIFDDGFNRDGELEYKGAKKFDFGLGIGAGLEFGQILVNLDTMFGLTKVADWEVYDMDEKLKKISPKNISVALSVGYKF